MTGYDFVQWFSGVLDMNPDGLSKEQIAVVREKMTGVKSPAQFAADAKEAGKPSPLGRC